MKRTLSFVIAFFLLALLYLGSYQTLNVAGRHGVSGLREVKLLGMWFDYTPAVQRTLSTVYRPLGALHSTTRTMRLRLNSFDPASGEMHACWDTDMQGIVRVPPDLVPAVSSLRPSLGGFSAEVEFTSDPNDIGGYLMTLKSVKEEK